MADGPEAIRSRLLAHAGTAALVDTRAVFLALEQNQTLPACVVQQISAPRHSAMGADVGKVEGRIQVRACATTRPGAKALAEQQRDALQRYSGTVSGTVLHDCFLVDEAEQYEAGTRLWSVRQDYMIWWSE